MKKASRVLAFLFLLGGLYCGSANAAYIVIGGTVGSTGTPIPNLDPFPITLDPSGTTSIQFVNQTGKTITDFHFDITSTLDFVLDPAQTTGTVIFGDVNIRNNNTQFVSVDFDIGSGVGIPMDAPAFIVNLVDFDPSTTSVTARATVPEPASLALMGLGLLGLAAIRSRQMTA